MTNNEQQLLLQLLFKTRERFNRLGGRPMVRCRICTNDWPEDSRADYHTSGCPVPACERMLLNEGVAEDEVYYPLARTPAERGRDLQPSERNFVTTSTGVRVATLPAGTKLSDVEKTIAEIMTNPAATAATTTEPDNGKPSEEPERTSRNDAA